MIENRFAGLVASWVLVAGSLQVGCMSLPKSEARVGRADEILRYEKLASRVRGLELSDAIAIEQESREEVLASFEKEFEKSDSRVFLEETELLLRQFRVLAPDASLKAFFLKMMSEQVAAYYDPESKRLVYVSEPPLKEGGQRDGRALPDMERFVYVHEFCHALEDAHFGLDPLMRSAMSDLDANLALTSFSEGTAVLAGVDGLLDGYGLPINSATPLGAWAVRLLGRLDLAEAAGEMEGTPPFLAAALLRPYLDGTVFCNRLRRDAGWGAIDRTYTLRPPRTTAEILYPERRYLAGFEAASFEPDPSLLRTAARGVSVNRLGVMGIALWLSGDDPSAPSRYGFLKGWLGDRVFLLKGESNTVQTVWLSLWERPDLARAFCRQATRRLRADFGDASYVLKRDGAWVVASWGSAGMTDGPACERLAQLALRTRVQAEAPGWLASAARDVPWPIRFPVHPGFSSGCEVLGGIAAEVYGGEQFFHMSVACGLLRAEYNPDRHSYGVLWGLVRHVSDTRSEFTFWKVPLLASWHRRGRGEDERFRWHVLWGLLADGTERRARLFFVPVWRDS